MLFLIVKTDILKHKQEVINQIVNYSFRLQGKGYPDLCTRRMVHRLWIELHIPVLALVDADPFGLHIAAVYKFGALVSLLN